MNLHISSLSSLDNEYTFPFLGTNTFFISIAWFHNFLVSILLLAFLPKMWICFKWNFSDTSLFTSSSSSQISYSSTTFFTSIILCFFFSFLFVLSLLISFLLPLFVFPTLIFLALVSIASHVPLDILLSLLPLFSNWSQDCSEPAMAFPRLYSTFTPQLHLSLFSPYVLDNKYLSLPYTPLVLSYWAFYLHFSYISVFLSSSI